MSLVWKCTAIFANHRYPKHVFLSEIVDVGLKKSQPKFGHNKYSQPCVHSTTIMRTKNSGRCWQSWSLFRSHLCSNMWLRNGSRYMQVVTIWRWSLAQVWLHFWETPFFYYDDRQGILFEPFLFQMLNPSLHQFVHLDSGRSRIQNCWRRAWIFFQMWWALCNFFIQLQSSISKLKITFWFLLHNRIPWVSIFYNLKHFYTK